MLLLIALLFFVWGCADGYEARAMRRDFDNCRARRREHEELMEATKERKPPTTKKKVTRTYARDERGCFVARETVEDL